MNTGAELVLSHQSAGRSFRFMPTDLAVFTGELQERRCLFCLCVMEALGTEMSYTKQTLNRF